MASKMMRRLVAAGGLHLAASNFSHYPDAAILVQNHVSARSGQPDDYDYERPQMHGLEKAKDSLVNSGKEIDSIMRNTKEALQNLTIAMNSPANRRCDLEEPLPEGSGTQLYIVDNADLRAATSGIGYRFQKVLWDRDMKTIARWGSTIEGVDHGDGWVQVGNCFLPTAVQDKPVLQLQQTKAKLMVADPAALLEIDGAPTMYSGPKAIQDRPREVELAQESAEDAVDKNGVALGDTMEVTIKGGDHDGQVVKGVVEDRDAENDVYELYLPHAPEGHRHVSSIPFSWLRRPDESAGKDGVLLFWAVTSKPSTMDLVTKNIDHLRSTYRGKADVFLLHIDDKAMWMERSEEWYNSSVQFSSEYRIPKQFYASASMLYAADFYPPQVRLGKMTLPQVVSKRDYKWIWMVDEDIDFSATDLNKLFGDADRSGSLIVAPAVSFEDRLTTLKAATKMYATGCSAANAMCFIHVPKPVCQYRYVNFVEAMFPIMKPAAFQEMAACTECDTQIDRFWCTHPAMRLMHDHNQVCAILDQATVTHTNGKTLRKWETVDRSHPTVLRQRLGDYVDEIATLKCVP
uniref:Uncharacterized protein n=1 Tax=Alexandrium catenella TaxID=2925 RepID=A0A7S1M5L4_ALECA|mmetsp:Transcript_20023/g.54570  ORF Transcript_20023/g.54570 Transcript_20023/m.54570 type:complete len:574 (+) Transcript_20023:65-1786(+)